MTTATTTENKFTIVTGTQIVEDYPYGFRERTTKYYSVEFKKGYGYRSVEVTLNPKTKKPNKPKTGTYSHFVYIVQDNETGHFSFKHVDFRDLPNVDSFINLLADNKDKFTFTPQESAEIYRAIAITVKVSLSFYKPKEGVTPAEVVETAKLAKIAKGANTAADIYELLTFGYSTAAIYSLVNEAPPTFTIREYSSI